MENNFKNTIINGDSLKVLNYLPKESVHLIITSPPYNLSIDYANHNDELPYEEYLAWMKQIWKGCKDVLVKGGRLCINIGENKRQNINTPTHSSFIQQCSELGFLYRGTIIWNKNSSAKHCAWGSWQSASSPHIVPRHEYIIIFSKDDYKLEGKKENTDMNGDEFMEYTRSVWNMGTESKTKIGHPAPFPLELPKRLIKFYSFQGQTVLDIFSGSGTVGVASHQLDRNFILIDNSLEYCQLAKKRIEKKMNNLFSTENNIEIIDFESLDVKIENENLVLI